MCLANRHGGVAPFWPRLAATAAAVAAVGANVLVVDPTAGTAYEKKQILRDFCLGGIREVSGSIERKIRSVELSI